MGRLLDRAQQEDCLQELALAGLLLALADEAWEREDRAALAQ